MTSAAYAYRRNQNLYRQKSALRLGPVSMTFVVIAAVCVLALLYLTQITKTSIYGYKVTDLQQHKARILADKQSLEVEAARLQSIERIQSSRVAAGMEEEKNVHYVR